MKRTAQSYLLIVSIVGLGIFFILDVGSQLPSPASRLSTQVVAVGTPHSTDLSGSSYFASLDSNLGQNATDPLSRLFLQLFILITVSGVVAWIFSRCGQPAVIGEMVAGYPSRSVALEVARLLVLVALMLFITKPILLSRLGQPAWEHSDPSKVVLAFGFVVVLLSALTTKLIGIDALVGAEVRRNAEHA